MCYYSAYCIAQLVKLEVQCCAMGHWSKYVTLTLIIDVILRTTMWFERLTIKVL
jgi:hypothetical protein